jgi:hypothetical protein
MDYSGYITLENLIIGIDVMKQSFDNVENVRKIILQSVAYFFLI